MSSQPPEQIPARDPDFERAIHEQFSRLVDAFVAQGLHRKEARLWIGAWRHIDQPVDLARVALAFHDLRVEAGQAIPWYWERIDPHLAVQYLPHRWRAAEARRLMQALQQQDPTLSRRGALRIGLKWAQADFAAAEALEYVICGYDLETAQTYVRSLAREIQRRPDPFASDEDSTPREWAAAQIPPHWVVRYIAAGITRCADALGHEQQRSTSPEGFSQQLALLAALRNGSARATTCAEAEHVAEVQRFPHVDAT